MNAPIGVFDSGVGGLTVVREIMRQLPGENVIYFGDTARVPYGSKSKQTVLKYSRQIVRFLMTKNVKAIVIACNTASALALEDMRDEINVPIMGVVRPGARMAVEMTSTKSVGVIGTDATIKLPAEAGHSLGYMRANGVNMLTRLRDFLKDEWHSQQKMRKSVRRWKGSYE